MNFFSKPVEDFSDQELTMALEQISSEFKKRNSKLGLKLDKPIDIAEGIKILTELLNKKR